MKKKWFLVAIPLIIATIFTAKSVYNDMPSSWLGTRSYKGDRITVNMYITVDGKKAQITKNDDTEYILHMNNDSEYNPYSYDDNKYNLHMYDDRTVLTARANDYNTYGYFMLINGNIPLNITARHWNWWEITKSNLYIDIDTKNNSYTVYENYKYTKESAVANSAVYSIDEVEEPKETFKGIESIDVNIGPKG